MAYDETNRGSIWKNDRKEKDTHPDFRGILNVEGVEYWVDAWKRKPDANPKAPALSFTVKLKEAKEQKAPVSAPSLDAMDDDTIPF